jgi:uncharacterized membrane protein YfhO
MISDKGYNRIAVSLPKFFGLETENYEELYYQLKQALGILQQTLDLQDALDNPGFQQLVQIVSELTKFVENYDSYKVIPLR